MIDVHQCWWGQLLEVLLLPQHLLQLAALLLLPLQQGWPLLPLLAVLVMGSWHQLVHRHPPQQLLLALLVVCPHLHLLHQPAGLPVQLQHQAQRQQQHHHAALVLLVVLVRLQALEGLVPSGVPSCDSPVSLEKQHKKRDRAVIHAATVGWHVGWHNSSPEYSISMPTPQIQIGRNQG